MSQYEMVTLGADERELLDRVFADLMVLAESQVPSVRAAAREAVAHVSQAMNGQGLRYEIYTGNWSGK
jgi:hypothetical protein